MKADTQKLFQVNLKGMTFSPTSTKYGSSYVIAKDPTEAYQKVRKFLDEKNIGFNDDRELDSVQLIAEDDNYPGCKIKLYL